MSRKLSRYEQITGLRETSPNAVLHRRFSLRSLIQVEGASKDVRTGARLGFKDTLVRPGWLQSSVVW
jgi:hypothetical protein